MIYITGHTGFIGKHLVKKLSPLQRLIHNELPWNTNNKNPLVHLASVTTLSKDFIPELFDTNISYSKQLFDKSKNERIVYASSTSAAELTNPYAYTKRYLEYLGEKHGNAVGLRFFNCYGPGNNKGIVKAALDAVFNGNDMVISGGDQVRDFIYIDDVVRTIIDSLNWEPGIYDVGTGKGTTIRHLIQMIEQITGFKINVTYTDKSDVDMEYSVASPPIPNCLPLYEGLKKMICEY